MNTARERILGRVRSALSPLPSRAERPDWAAGLVHTQVPSPESLWAGFEARFRAVNGTPLADFAALNQLILLQGWKQGYCAPELWPLVSRGVPITVAVSLEFVRSKVDSYEFSITSATAAIAETGTLVLSDEQTPNRLAALAPWAHIAVVRDSCLVPDLLQAVTRLPKDPNVIWVTGPSKTADVEGILIEGVHGPGIQAALRVKE